MATATPAVSREPLVRYIPIAQLYASKTNPRKHFEQKALGELADSIKEKGVLVPLLVRPGWHKLDGSDQTYEIVAGERRFRAAQQAQLLEVPAIIRDFDDVQALEVQVIENLQRADVHPLEEAQGYRQLLTEAKYKGGVETIAEKVGKSASYVYQRLKLADLIEPAKKAFLEDEITAGHAILIARLQLQEQKEALKQATDRWNKLSVRELADWIDENIHLDLTNAPWKKDDATLVSAAGACTTCPKRTGFAKALFPDVQKGDICTDPGCFKQKTAAIVKIRVKETPGVQLISTRDFRSGNDEKALRKLYPSVLFDFKKAGAIKCKNTVEALVVDGDGVGTRIKVCTAERRCPMHGASEQSYSRPKPAPRSEKEIVAAKREQAKRELDGKIGDAIFIAAVEGIKARGKVNQIPVEAWRIAAVGIWHYGFGQDELLSKALGIKASDLTEKHIFKLDLPAVLALIFAYVMEPSAGNLTGKDAVSIAEMVGVNTAALKANVTAEVKLQTSAAPAAKAKKAAASA